jgi:PIN domain nuclease of toxin-antitoxin system
MGVAVMIVLDTHIIVWDALNPEKLSEKAKEAIYRANEEDGIIFYCIAYLHCSQNFNDWKT